MAAPSMVKFELWARWLTFPGEGIDQSDLSSRETVCDILIVNKIYGIVGRVDRHIHLRPIDSS